MIAVWETAMVADGADGGVGADSGVGGGAGTDGGAGADDYSKGRP